MKEDGWRMVKAPNRPEPVGLVPAVEKEISPCSEYTRFTVEGRFPGPGSNMNAVLDGEVLGKMFSNGPFKNPRWSSKLGYGMAVIDEDTRVHLHSNGKYIIRRAMDKDHALKCQTLLAAITRPAVYSTSMDSFIWEKVRDLSLGVEEVNPESISLVNWQLEDGENIGDTALASFNEMNGKYGRKIDELMEEEKTAEMENIASGGDLLLDELRVAFSRLLESDHPESGRVVGVSSFASLSYMALKMRSG